MLAYVLGCAWFTAYKRTIVQGIFASVIVPIVIMFYILPVIVFPTFNIYPGGKQEAIATMLQQSARVSIDHSEAYSEQDKVLLNRIFDFNSVSELYDYSITDPIKNTYKLESVSAQDLNAYYLLWLRTGVRYPLTYIKATAGTCAGYFSPTVQMNVYRDNHSYELTDSLILRGVRRVIDSLYDLLLDIPGISIFFYLVVYTWWIPLIVTYRIVKDRGVRAIGLMVPVYISIMILIVCPYSFSRYALPLVAVTPLVCFLPKCVWR